MNIMHKLHERPDWIAPFPGRNHHAHWCANVIHPDMRLIAAAPKLLAALEAMVEMYGPRNGEIVFDGPVYDAVAAIAKAKGEL